MAGTIFHRCCFFDFHTLPECPDVGKKLDCDHFTAQLAEAGCDYLVFPAKCNIGMSYHPTEVGIAHPGLAQDLTGNLCNGAHRAGIGFSAYINVGLSHEQLNQHPEWSVIAPEWRPLSTNKLDSFFRRPCLNTPYRDWIYAIIRETATRCDVDGFFFDCMQSAPCVCPACMAKMTAAGIDTNDPEAVYAFAKHKMLDVCTEIKRLVRAIRPNAKLFFNGPAYSDLAVIADFIEFECLPNGGWGYDALPVFGRYMRKLGLPVVNMTARFHHGWADFGGLRTRCELEYDAFLGLACGIDGTTFGDHLPPDGTFYHEILERYRPVWTAMKDIEPYCRDSRAIVEAAILSPAYGFDFSRTDAGEAYFPLCGAMRMLDELKWQYDIITPDMDFASYPLLIVPESVRFDAATAARFDEYLRNGGRAIISGKGGLDATETVFAPLLIPSEYYGKSTDDPIYLQTSPDAMPLALYDGATLLAPRLGASLGGKLLRSYFSRHWNGRHGYVYNPPAEDTGYPGWISNRTVLHFAWPVFSDYHHHGYTALRTVFAEQSAALRPKPLVVAENLASFAKVSLRKLDATNTFVLHIVNYCPRRSGEGVESIEEPATSLNVKISLKIDAPTRLIQVVPNGCEIPFEEAEGRLNFTLPQVTGYTVIAIHTQAKGI